MNRDEMFLELSAIPLKDIVEVPDLGKAEVAGLRAAQLRQTGAAAEAQTEVVGEGANVSAFGGFDFKGGARRGEFFQGEFINMNKSRLAFNFLTFTGEFVERHAVHFDG